MFSNFKSISTVGLVLIIACFGVAYFVLTPQYSKYSLAKTKLVQTKDENTSLNQALNSVQSFVDNYKKYQKDSKNVNLALPLKSSDMTDFISNIGDLAKSSGVLLSNFSVNESTSEKPLADNSIQVVSINLTASGSYLSFKDFVLRLEKNLRIVDLGQFTVKSDSNGALQYQLIINTYYQK